MVTSYLQLFEGSFYYAYAAAQIFHFYKMAAMYVRGLDRHRIALSDAELIVMP